MSDVDFIKDMLLDGVSPSNIAHHLVDRDVSQGEYEGCSVDLELAWNDYHSTAVRLRETLRPPSTLFASQDPMDDLSRWESEGGLVS